MHSFSDDHKRGLGKGDSRIGEGKRMVLEMFDKEAFVEKFLASLFFFVLNVFGRYTKLRVNSLEETCLSEE